MFDKRKFLKMLNDLTAEEKSMIRGILSSSEEDAEKTVDAKAVKEVSEETTKDGATEAISKEESKETTTPISEADDDEDIDSKQTIEDVDAAGSDGEEVSEPTNHETEESIDEVATTEDDYIPPMEKTNKALYDDDPEMEASVNEDEILHNTGHETPIVDTDGNDMPIDYESIIDGLNAKILAYESEIKKLRSKTEGAFGYSAKPNGPSKVNPLYDDCADIVFRK